MFLLISCNISFNIINIYRVTAALYSDRHCSLFCLFVVLASNRKCTFGLLHDVCRPFLMVDGHSSSSAAYMNLEDLEELVMLLF